MLVFSGQSLQFTKVNEYFVDWRTETGRAQYRNTNKACDREQVNPKYTFNRLVALGFDCSFLRIDEYKYLEIIPPGDDDDDE